MSRSPRVSIGLPVYNGEKHLRQTLDSLLEQDFSDFEIIISDNGSCDGTQKICQEYASKDGRIKYKRHDVNRGAAWNFNYVFEQGLAPYFMWAAHDDYWHPSYLHACLEAFKDSDNAVLIGAMCDCLDEQTLKVVFVDPGVTTVGLKPQDRFRKYKTILHRINHVGAIFYGIYKRNVLQKVMPLRSDITADHLVLAELSLEGEFLTLNKVLMSKRRGGGSRNFDNIARILQITNPFVVRCPYLVREFSLQKIIFWSGQLRWTEKLSLSFWSLVHYFVFYIKRNYWLFRDSARALLKQTGESNA